MNREEINALDERAFRKVFWGSILTVACFVLLMMGGSGLLPFLLIASLVLLGVGLNQRYEVKRQRKRLAS